MSAIIACRHSTAQDSENNFLAAMSRRALGLNPVEA
jgi:hypothetical protein